MKLRHLTTKLVSGFLRFKAKRPKPIFVSYNITSRCNMRCSFCNWWKMDVPELPTKQALRVIDKVCGQGISFFDFSGGEPSLRKDLPILAKQAQSHGCLVSMNTNGTLLHSSSLSKIADVFDVIVVSLDGPAPIHDEIRGVPGTYRKAIRAVKELKACGLRVGVNSVITPLNIAVLPRFIEEIRGLVDFAQVQPVHPYPPPPQHRPSVESLTNLLNYMLELKRNHPGFLAVPTEFVKGFESFFSCNAPKICHAGELYIAINPAGRLLACPARADIVLGDILTDPVTEILKARTKNPDWLKVLSCKGCWLECTVGLSLILGNPLKEAPTLISTLTSHRN